MRRISGILTCLTGLVLGVMTPRVTTAALIQSPSQSAVNAAISCPLISYGSGFSGGAYTNGAWFGGASVVLAAASHAGNTTADARLLQQIRHSIVGTNAICANGAYPAQHERHATGMFAIARHTPRIWKQLTAAEISRIHLLMKASLVASAFTTSNNNPYVLAGTQQYSLDGDSNMNRDWNPNYREGMIGGMLVAMVYFGGPARTDAILNGYNHASFVSELLSAGLTNPYQIFNWKAANPASPAPTGSMIENAVRNYRYYGSGLSDYMGIYNSLSGDTFGKNVNAGLNGGAGIGGSGRIAGGAATLPNPGAAGMLKEFDSADGYGARSSLDYAYDGYRPHQTNQLVLVIGGYWPKGKAVAQPAVNRMKVGLTDLWYKMSKGYYNYSSGAARGYVDLAYMNDNRGFGYVRSLWEDVLLPYHDSAAEVDTDADGDGTGDSVEVRLGLDPFDGGSRFTAKREGNLLTWPGNTGLVFQIQRSIGGSLSAWQTIATVNGISGVNSFTLPASTQPREFYRIALPP